MKKATLTFFAILFIFTVFAPRNAHAVMIFDGHWYEAIFVESGNWNDAQAEAVALGGNLVTINNENEQNWLHSNFDSSIRYWIGFTDFGHEADWQWISGEPVTCTHWLDGEPNNHIGLEHFAAMNYPIEVTPGGGFWNDFSVDNTYPNGTTTKIDYGIAEGITAVIPNPNPQLSYFLARVC